jgi:hypothetical protein
MEIQQIFKAHGWTGSHFRNSEDNPMEVDSLLQNLSNFYLKQRLQRDSSHTSKLLCGTDDGEGIDPILSFCPDLLLACLKKYGMPKANSQDVITHTFMGACMLADISGFSMFSGSMCSKGASGLDDLRNATSVFLGYLVETVYEFQGDGRSKLFFILRFFIYFKVMNDFLIFSCRFCW